MTGKRLKRSTKTTNMRIALRKAGEFEDEYQRELVGFKKLDKYKLDLVPLAEEWISSAKWKHEGKRDSYRSQIMRAFELLKLKKLADLNDVSSLNKRLQALQVSKKNPEGFPAKTLEESVQYPLKLFAKWATANQRYLPSNPLASWAKHDTTGHVPDVARALEPDEVVRGFAAARCLDRLEEEENPLYPAYVTALITAPRSERLCQLDVQDFNLEKGDLAYGEPVGKKLPPAGALDPKTRDLLVAYLGERTSGPLFLSREGSRLDPKRLLMAWRRAMGLAFVDALWPAELPRELDDLIRVNTILVTGKPYKGEGGNPKRVSSETKKRIADEGRRLHEIADQVRAVWSERMDGVTVRSFRRSLETWARAKGVPEVLIDKHVGHKAPARDAALETAKELIVSSTGRDYYLDNRLALLDCRRVAVAIRELLDEAETALEAEAKAGRTALVAHRVAHGDSELNRAEKEEARSQVASGSSVNRGDRIRTYDLCVPNAAL